MKKVLLLLGTILVVALIIFVLFKNKAEMKTEARLNQSVKLPVSAAAVIKQTLNGHISQVATINAYSDVMAVSELQGQAVAVMVQEGSYVSAGTPIAKLEAQVPEANLVAAKDTYQKSQKDWERSVSMHDQGIISDSQLEAARLTFQASDASYVSAQHQYHNSIITSPISGIVTSLPIQVGTMVSPGMTVAEVVDITKFKVKLNVAEQDAFKLKVGDTAMVETTVYPGVKYSGKIETISAKGDDAHTYPVTIVIRNNKEHPLKSGMFGQVSFNLGSQVALTIPRDAIVGSVDNPQVFVVEKGKAKLRNIQVGSEIDTNIIVLQGLSEGEKVVVSGQETLKDNVSVVIQSDMSNQSSGKDGNSNSNYPSGKRSGHRKGNPQNS